ncbi:hypothetical protein HY501_02830 [Candidatus Woesearchaeota archaeon]|nr:hypothetical protein [Candidatus Woesearchaeota archaeon]
MNDSAGNLNATALLNFTVTDTVIPLVGNLSHDPNTTDALDPGTVIFVTFNLSDEGVAGAAILQYRNESTDLWTNATFLKTSLKGFYGNFTPNVQMNWSYRVFFNDSLGNSNFSSMTNLSIEVDYTWNPVPANISVIGGIIGTSFTYLNLTLNNTGDERLFFNLTSAAGTTPTLTVNASGLVNVTNNSYSIVYVNVSVPAVQGNYFVGLNISTTNANATPLSSMVNTTLQAHTGGSYLSVLITEYDSSLSLGDHADFKGEIMNVGNDTALDVQSLWILPTGWNARPDVNRTIGNMSVANNTLFLVTIDVNGSTASAGTFTVILQANTSDNKEWSDNKTVVVTSNATEEDESAPSSSAGGGSGGGGLPRADVVTNLTDSLDLVKGERRTILFLFKNVASATDILNDAGLEIDGYSFGGITFSPSKVDGVGYNEYGSFLLEVHAPEYLELGEYSANISLVALLQRSSHGQVASEREIRKTESLLVRVLSVEGNRTEQKSLLAEKALEQLRSKGYNTIVLDRLYLEAQKRLAEGKYADAEKLFDEFFDLKDKAYATHQSIVELRGSLEDAISRDLDVRSSMRLFKNALRAFNNGDFEAAESFLEKARLASFFEVEVGGFWKTGLGFMSQYWYLFLISFLAFLAVGYSLRKNLFFIYTTKRLAAMARKEEAVIGKIKELQTAYYDAHRISAKVYTLKAKSYYDLLTQIHLGKFHLRSKRIGILKFLSDAEMLKREAADVREAVLDLQDRYYRKNLLPEKVYNTLLRDYNERLLEIEKEIRLMGKGI